MSEKKRMGRPPKYARDELRDNGAPKLNFRFDPVLYQHVQKQPEGPRAFLERLVESHMKGASVTLEADRQAGLIGKEKCPHGAG